MRRILPIFCTLLLAGCASVEALRAAPKGSHTGAHLSNPLQLFQTAQEEFGVTGEYQTTDFDPLRFLTTWNFNNLPPEERAKVYTEKRLVGGKKLREYRFSIEDREIEVAPGVFYPAWTYNEQVPGPTIRALEGDTVRIHFTNTGTKPHTMHFHGFHPAEMDGSAPEHLVLPGGTFTYEFTAGPFGTHLYHCHSYPTSHHIARGLYGAFIIDPRNDHRPKPDREFVMVMNGFDTDFDGANDIYAVNTRAFAYAKAPIPVRVGERIRIHLSNLLEFDLLNSFHLHANFFDLYRTGTRREPDSFTDILQMAQGERAILDTSFSSPGMYMFHAHVGEFSELGWMGMFHVTE